MSTGREGIRGPAGAAAWRGSALAVGASAVLLGFLYWPLLGRGFVSEDYLIVRMLSVGPRLLRALEQFVGPWLGAAIVGFYRPVSSFFLSLEVLAFGPQAPGFNLVHLGVHLLNCWLVMLLVEELVGARDWRANWCGLLFAAYPLHWNAVAFIASFATLFGSSFSLLAVLWHRRHERLGGWGWEALALLAFLLALGSYELAAVVPALIGMTDLVSIGGWRQRWSSVARGWVWWLIPLGAYLFLRRALFGGVLGGYSEFARALTPSALVARLPRAAEVFSYQLLPWTGLDGMGVPRLVLALLVGVVALCWLVVQGRRQAAAAAAARVLVLALGWALIAQLPFSFAVVVPGNGRYWYLAAVGVSLAIVAACAALEWKGRTWPRFAALSAVLALWIGLALHLRPAHVEAAAKAQQIRLALRRELEATPASEVVLAGGYPTFVRTATTGTPLAQVFHWGLSDAANPPFAAARRAIYPLTPGLGIDAEPMRTRGEPMRELLWSEAGGGLVRVEPKAKVRLPTFELSSGPAEGTVYLPAESTVSWRGEDARAFRLVVLAEGNAWSGASSPVISCTGERCETRLPREFLETMANLYSTPAFWWIEERTTRGDLRATSVPRQLRLEQIPVP